MGIKSGIAAAILAAAIGFTGTGTVVLTGEGRRGFRETQKTTKDKLYTKEQATRGAELYVKYCEKCHTPEKVPEGKKPGPPVVGAKFLDTWADRPLGELFDTIMNTMPSDGSAVLTVDQVLDSVAHILQANGFPDGPAPLKNDEAMKTAIIVKG